MSILLTLPPELETKLTAQANSRGMALSDYVLELLSNDVATAPGERTGADLVAYWQKEGLVGTRPDIANSAVHARTIRERAETRS